MEKLGIIRWQDTGYYLADLGEVLHVIVKDTDDACEELSVGEKAFYFRALFYGPTFAQLALLLNVLAKNVGASRQKMTAEYFRSVLNSRVRLWKPGYVKSALKEYEEKGMLPRSCMNRFDTMRMWLHALGLLKNFNLTEAGYSILWEIDPGNRLPEDLDTLHARCRDRVYLLIGCLLGILTTKFNPNLNAHWKLFLEAFRKGYELFERPSIRLSNVRAIKTWICIYLLLSHNVCLEETEFESNLYRLEREAVVRSIIRGDDGKMAYVSIK